MSKKRVAVVGGGPSGLSALRHLANDPDHFIPVAYEKNREVGGLWNYSDRTEIDEYGLPCFSSLYKGLRINLPKEVMCFPDCGYPPDSALPSFVHHTEVKKYLDNYADIHDLNKYVQFQTIVTAVKPCNSSENTTWLVTSRCLADDTITTASFDSVMICVGSENKPHVPSFPGLERFRGSIVHTQNLRDDEVYRGMTVLLVGASYSAQDIIFNIGAVANKMYVAHRGPEPLPFEIPSNVHDTSNVREVLPNGVLLEDGQCREVDAIILATGYEYDFPFLAPEIGISIKDERIQPLYNHMIKTDSPSLVFIGLLKGVLEFQVAFVQAQYACAVLRGDVILPEKAEMCRQEEEDYQTRVVTKGKQPKIAHDFFGSALRGYVEKLERESGYSAITKGALKFYDRYCYVIANEYGTLKQRTYRLIGDDDFEETM